MAQPSEYDAVPAHSPGPTQEAFSATEVHPQPPQPPFLAAEGGSPRFSSYQGTQNDSQSFLAGKGEPDSEGGVVAAPERKKRSPVVMALIALVVLILVVLAVILPVYFTVIKKNNNNEAASSTGDSTSTNHGTGTTTNGPAPSVTAAPTRPTTGGDGSTVTGTNGTTFTYVNSFGGIWVEDPDRPYSNDAYPNSWTPPLNTSWNFGTNRMWGVNLGGWFVLEPFISPEIFQRYPGTNDEWSLSLAMAADTARGGLAQLEEHYKTFITEQDIAEIAGAGLNWVRLPVPYWAIDKLPNEPFLEKVSWKYIIQALQWCRKYGIRVKLDLHTLPGSHNGWNHSGKLGTVNFLRGTMGMANAQRGLNYIRIFTEFISQPEWKDVVPIFGIMNEGRMSEIGQEPLRAFYAEAYRMIREITGTGAGKGPVVSIHDGFRNTDAWVGYLPGADRLALDQHPYFAFNGGPALEPIDTGVGAGAGGEWVGRACGWASRSNQSRIDFGIYLAGEWSLGFNDCGLYLNGVGGTYNYGGNCADWQDSSLWSAGTKAGLLAFCQASMDALGDYFFWTWKIGPSQRGIVETPLWSYQNGLRNNYIPADPRSAVGKCGAGVGPTFTGAFSPWQTGVGPFTADPAAYPFPPGTFMDAPAAPAQLPMYTPTGVINVLPAPTYTDSKGQVIPAGNGWFNAQDTVLAPVPVAGCTYPDQWDSHNAAIPACAVGVAPIAPPAAAAVPT